MKNSVGERSKSCKSPKVDVKRLQQIRSIKEIVVSGMANTALRARGCRQSIINERANISSKGHVAI